MKTQESFKKRYTQTIRYTSRLIANKLADKSLNDLKFKTKTCHKFIFMTLH